MRLTLASPCTESWAKMVGGDRVRFCGKCRLNVYNLSGLTELEATRLARRTSGGFCARFFARRDGTVLTRDCRAVIGRRFVLRFVWAVGSLLFGAVVTLVAVESAKRDRGFVGLLGEYIPSMTFERRGMGTPTDLTLTPWAW